MVKRNGADTRPNADLHSTASAPWTRGEAPYLAGRAHIDQADALAIEMERKWGAGRLRLIVSPDLAARFDSQRARLNRAVNIGELEDVRREAGRMQTAWRALDAAATAAGKPCLSPLVWEVAMDSGCVIAIVRDSAEGAIAGRVLYDGRHVTVYTLEEIASILAGFPELARLKQEVPGATVTAVRPPTDPLIGLADFDDPIPF